MPVVGFRHLRGRKGFGRVPMHFWPYARPGGGGVGLALKCSLGVGPVAHPGQADVNAREVVGGVQDLAEDVEELLVGGVGEEAGEGGGRLAAVAVQEVGQAGEALRRQQRQVLLREVASGPSPRCLALGLAGVGWAPLPGNKNCNCNCKFEKKKILPPYLLFVIITYYLFVKILLFSFCSVLLLIITYYLIEGKDPRG